MVQKITFNRSRQKDAALRNIDVVILCGGLGTRLRPVLADKPKALAEIGSVPFLDILIDSLLSHGFQRIILAVGHLAEHVKAHYGAKIFSEHEPYEIIFSEETAPLGTGGAVKHALRFVESEHVLVLNGDCFCKIDFSNFYRMHLQKNALLSIALAAMKDTSEYGQVLLDDWGRIREFREKSSEKMSGIVSAGAYFMHASVFGHLPPQKVFSLERDLFPRFLMHSCYGFCTNSEVLDIGVPARYQKAIELFSGND